MGFLNLGLGYYAYRVCICRRFFSVFDGPYIPLGPSTHDSPRFLRPFTNVTTYTEVLPKLTNDSVHVKFLSFFDRQHTPRLCALQF